ncbi:MAG: hypothetical protein ACK4R9_01850 [Ignavibacterium sp.]
MKRQHIYLGIIFILFIILSAVIYDRVQLAEELNNIKENLGRLKIEGEQKLMDAERVYQTKIIDAERGYQTKIQEATVIADAKIKEAENFKVKYENLLAREEKKLENYYGNLYKYNYGYNYFNNSAIKSFRIDGDMIYVTIQNDGSKAIKPDFTIYFLNENGFITATYSDVYIFSSVLPGETRISDGRINFRFGTPVYYSLNESY